MRGATGRAQTCVALLRGINVGGKHLLPMAELVRMFESVGCSDVRTYIQSGNVVFVPPASAAAAKRVGGAVSERIAERFGFEPVIVLRAGEEIARIAAEHPFWSAEADAKMLHVGFLAGAPAATAVARLDPKRSPQDRFEVRGQEIYVHFGRGVAESRLTNAYIDSVLGITSTFRNWRTVGKLAEMAGMSA